MSPLLAILKPFNGVTINAIAVLLLPLFTFWFLILFGRVINRYRGYMATAIMLGAFILSISIFLDAWGAVPFHTQWSWFSLSKGFHDTESIVFKIGIKVDSISALMILIVTFVSFLVHLFSIEYLRGDKNFEKYFAYLGLFTFSMLGIILSDNLLLIFIFWELVGLSSYLLIGFWYKNKNAAFASKKAFLANRVGDAGFLIGILILWSYFGTTDLDTIRTWMSITNTDSITFWLIVAGIGIFFGAVGKSAQFPLSVWLPNAMEGPTPVSALIHAATMVAAGVYLLARTYFLFNVDIVLPFIAVIGTITAFMAAFTAMTQFDIKRVLAFSTISQLGYMVMGMGVGAYDASLFHLMTHAFFKACLFLSAGAVIHSMHHVETFFAKKGTEVHFDPQDMRNMGNLRKRMPVTFITYTIAAFALAGLPLFSGFLSKDAILISAWQWADKMAATGSGIWYIIPIVGFVTAFMTAFYMGRQLCLVFWGEFRLDKKYEQLKGAFQQVIETPWLMRIPVIVLAILSIGFVYSLNPLSGEHSWFMETIQTKVSIISHKQKEALHIADHHAHHTAGLVISICLAVIGLVLAWFVYNAGKNPLSNVVKNKFSENSFLFKLSYNNWYLDEFYMATIIKANLAGAKVMSLFDIKVIDGFVNFIGKFHVVLAHIVAFIDKYIVDGFVNGISWFFKTSAGVIRGTQNGQVQLYLVWTAIGVLLLLGWILF